MELFQTEFSTSVKDSTKFFFIYIRDYIKKSSIFHPNFVESILP